MLQTLPRGTFEDCYIKNTFLKRAVPLCPHPPSPLPFVVFPPFLDSEFKEQQMCLSRINGCCPDRGKTGVRRTVWAGVGGEDGAGWGLEQSYTGPGHVRSSILAMRLLLR